MAIADKCRKQLWSQSGNCCAICKGILVQKTGLDSDSLLILGEECHIIARETNGPRGQSDLPKKDRDKYDNLILLCLSDHKQIDDNPNHFTIEILKKIKSEHENWVLNKLSSKVTSSNLEIITELWDDLNVVHGKIYKAIVAYRSYVVPRNEKEFTTSPLPEFQKEELLEEIQSKDFQKKYTRAIDKFDIDEANKYHIYFHNKFINKKIFLSFELITVLDNLNRCFYDTIKDAYASFESQYFEGRSTMWETYCQKAQPVINKIEILIRDMISK